VRCQSAIPDHRDVTFWNRPDTNHCVMDRRLAQKNIRTALIAGAISFIVFGASFLAAAVY